VYTQLHNLPCNLCGFGQCLAPVNLQLTFHKPLKHCVIVIQLYLPIAHNTHTHQYFDIHNAIYLSSISRSALQSQCTILLRTCRSDANILCQHTTFHSPKAQTLTFDLFEWNIGTQATPALTLVLCAFLLLVCYVPNVAKRSIWDQCNI